MTVRGACTEVRIDDNVLSRATSTSMWNVRVTRLASGDEDREEIWSQSIRRIQLSYGSRLSAEIDAVREFVEAVGGPATSFCVCDPSDDGPGTTPALWYDLSDLTDEDRTLYTLADGSLEMPLFRGYEVSTTRRYRRVTKPRPSGFRCWLNDNEITDNVVVDFARGLVYIDYLPTSGRLTFSGYYDLCVRVDGDFTAGGITPDVKSADRIAMKEVIGEADYSPTSESDEILAALGRSQRDLDQLLANMRTLVAT